MISSFISLAVGQLDKIFLTVLAFFGLILVKRNDNLVKQNEAINAELVRKNRDIIIKTKVLHVVENTPDGNVALNIKRMHEDVL